MSLRLREKYLKSTTEPVPIEVIQGDFLNEDWWSDSDFVLMNSQFNDDLMQQISEKATNLKVGSWFVSMFKPLPVSEDW